MPNTPESCPNRIPWPPLIYAGAAVIALALGSVIPLAFEPARLIGAALLALGLSLDGAAMVTMAKAKTNILPHRGADRLVTSGPFAFSRNPIYLGNTILLLGAAVLLGNGWFVIAAIAGAFATQHLAIRREEAHLAARFGKDWEAYSARVPRWLRHVG